MSARGPTVVQGSRDEYQRPFTYVPTPINTEIMRKYTFARRRNCSKTPLGRKDRSVYFDVVIALV